jgi:hypothetical protein
LAEWVIHALIDFCKCRRWYGLSTDQALHLLCKLVWVSIAAQQLQLPLF